MILSSISFHKSASVESRISKLLNGPADPSKFKRMVSRIKSIAEREPNYSRYVFNPNKPLDSRLEVVGANAWRKEFNKNMPNGRGTIYDVADAYARMHVRAPLSKNLRQSGYRSGAILKEQTARAFADKPWPHSAENLHPAKELFDRQHLLRSLTSGPIDIKKDPGPERFPFSQWRVDVGALTSYDKANRALKVMNAYKDTLGAKVRIYST